MSMAKTGFTTISGGILSSLAHSLTLITSDKLRSTLWRGWLQSVTTPVAAGKGWWIVNTATTQPRGPVRRFSNCVLLPRGFHRQRVRRLHKSLRSQPAEVAFSLSCSSCVMAASCKSYSRHNVIEGLSLVSAYSF